MNRFVAFVAALVAAFPTFTFAADEAAPAAEAPIGLVKGRTEFWLGGGPGHNRTSDWDWAAGEVTQYFLSVEDAWKTGVYLKTSGFHGGTDAGYRFDGTQWTGGLAFRRERFGFNTAQETWRVTIARRDDEGRNGAYEQDSDNTLLGVSLQHNVFRHGSRFLPESNFWANFDLDIDRSKSSFVNGRSLREHPENRTTFQLGLAEDLWHQQWRHGRSDRSRFAVGAVYEFSSVNEDSSTRHLLGGRLRYTYVTRNGAQVMADILPFRSENHNVPSTDGVTFGVSFSF